MRRLTLAAALVALPVTAQQPAQIEVFQCRAEGCVMLSTEDFARLVESNRRMAEELRTLRESKGCAKLEVLPERRS